MTSRFRELGAAAGNAVDVEAGNAEDAEKFMTEFFSVCSANSSSSGSSGSSERVLCAAMRAKAFLCVALVFQRTVRV